MKPIIIESEEQLLEYKGTPLTPEEEEKEFAVYLIEKWSNDNLYYVRISDEETDNSDKEKEAL